MSNGGAPLPAGNSTLASAPVANLDPAGPPPGTSAASASASINGTGRADQGMNEMPESATSAMPNGQPNGSSATVPAPSPGGAPVPTLAAPMAQDNTPPDGPPPQGPNNAGIDLGNSGDPEELEIEVDDPSDVSDSSNKEGSGGTEDAETEPGDREVVETGTVANHVTNSESGDLPTKTRPDGV